MKISLGWNLQKGPFGGGNQVGRSVVNHLREKGVSVYFDLKEPDLDLILLAEPRNGLAISAYTHKQILKYLLLKNSKAVVAHRINECDERKGSGNVNSILMRANICADHTIFISGFLQDLFINRHGLKTPESSVIRIGVDPGEFHSNGYRPWDGQEKLRLVTHHWGGIWLKGFDIYERLDQMMVQGEFKDKIEFTYIGNVPKGFAFKNATHLPPMDFKELAANIRTHHVYVTGSQNEPAGLHHQEGAMCGLPVLYRKSGALPEYCKDYGLGFEAEDFVDQLKRMISEYPRWVEEVKKFPRDKEKVMCEEYYACFKDLIARRDEIRARRRLWSRPMDVIRALRT